MLRVERLSADEAPRLRAIRLRALADAPDAFGATLEEASARTTETWAQQMRELPSFVAVKGGLDVGMVRCEPDATRADTASLISMWVAPAARRSGVGDALIDAAIEWARANGVNRAGDRALRAERLSAHRRDCHVAVSTRTHPRAPAGVEAPLTT